ncbi:MAG: hypothetical protein ACJA0S_000723 [Rickettsiales bacterium]|jgi:hypothetical protein
MENKMTINKIFPLKLGYFHQEDQDRFLGGQFIYQLIFKKSLNVIMAC